MVGIDAIVSRKVTTKLIDLATDGVLDWEQLAKACLNYLSEAEVAHMAEVEQFDELWNEE